MARTLNPLSSEKATGSFGRVITFKPRRTLTVVARKSSPSQPQTSPQVARRAAFAALSRSWAGLSPAQVQAWRDYAAGHPVTDSLGASVVLPAYDAYIKSNLAQRFEFGSNPPAPQPGNHAAELDHIIFLPVSIARLDYAWTWPAGAGPGWLVAIWLQGPLANRNRALRQPEQRFLRYVQHPTNTGEILGLERGKYYHAGMQLCPVGVFPRAANWSGPYLIN